MAAFFVAGKSYPAISYAVKLQGIFGVMSLMPAMRRASEFSELLTEKSSLFVMEKAAFIFIYDKNIRENIQIDHLKDKIVKENTNKREQNTRHLGIEPELPGHSND